VVLRISLASECGGFCKWSTVCVMFSAASDGGETEDEGGSLCICLLFRIASKKESISPLSVGGNDSA